MTDIGPYPMTDRWVGATHYSDGWSVYTGSTNNPFGSIIRDGYRVRTIVGYTTYRYTAEDDGRRRSQGGFAESLIGYRWTFGPLFLTALGGAAWKFETIDPQDYSRATGARYRAKGVLETWLNVTESIFVKADFAVSHDDIEKDRTTDIEVRAVAGTRLGDYWLLGAETGYTTKTHEDARLEFSGFGRFEWQPFALELSGGVVRDADGMDPYARASLGLRY